MNRDEAIDLLKEYQGEIKFKGEDVVVYCRGYSRGDSIVEAVQNLVQELEDLSVKNDES